MSDTVNRPDVIYCHGLPGSPEELCFLSQKYTRPKHILGPQDRGEIDNIFDKNSNHVFHVIGFSLGSMAAIKIAGKHQNRVCKLSLISPAAPLELGDFLPEMAGRIVFQAASKGAFQLRILTALQNVGVRFFSERTSKAIFTGSPESDIALLSEPGFKTALLAGFEKSYGKNNRYYRQELHEYVRPWKHQLAKISCPVSIYHGGKDNWAPVEMAHALKNEIPSTVDVIQYNELGHYSTLRQALPIVLNG